VRHALHFHFLFLFLAIVGLTACSSSSSDGGSSGTDQGGVPCTITLSGAITKTLSCNSSAGFTTSDNLGSLNLTTIGVAPGAGSAEATFTFTVKGDLQTTTYTWQNSTVQQAAVVEDNGSSTWKSDMAAQIGSSTLTLTGLTLGGTSAEGKLYEPHGSVTATLVGQSGTAGQVTFSASF
jgi:hypothetical protein